MMLKIIGDGWSKLSIFEENNGKFTVFNGFPCFNSNVPQDTLQAFIDYYCTGTGSASYDEEGTAFSMVLDSEGVHIVGSNLYDNAPSVRAPLLLHIDIRTWAELLCMEIEHDIDNWARFSLDYPATDNVGFMKNKDMLVGMIEELRQLIGVWQYAGEGELIEIK